MSARVGGLQVAMALALVAAATVALAQQPENSESSFDGANCYGCHRAWSPVPMRRMFDLVPAEDGALRVGVPAEYGLTVDHAWLAKPPWPKLMRFESAVDLAAAPSLGFVSEQPPILGVQRFGTIEPVGPLEDARYDDVIEVPAGTSDLVITLAANSTDGQLGPDLWLVLDPGKSRVGTTPIVWNQTGRGQAEKFVLHGGRNITAAGSGTWAVRAQLAPSTAPAGREVNLEQRAIPVTFTVDAYRNLTGETRQFQVVEREVQAGQSTILPFALVATAPPAPGEHVLVTVNATSYYPHEVCCQDDWGNISKAIRLDVTAGPDGTVLLGVAATDTLTVTPGAARLPLDRVSEAVGYLSAFLILASIVSGGMFGKGSRRALNAVFGAAKRRVAFHNALSYFLLLAAIVHTVLFLVEQNYYWTLGILWGGAGILAMAGLAVTGAWQVAFVRSWGYAGWRWTHFGLAVAAIALTLVHMALDGANFGFVQEAVGWEAPFPDPSLEANRA